MSIGGEFGGPDGGNAVFTALATIDDGPISEPGRHWVQMCRGVLGASSISRHLAKSSANDRNT
jgi:hypothetical protein